MTVDLSLDVEFFRRTIPVALLALHVKVVDDGQKNGICFLRGLVVIGSML